LTPDSIQQKYAQTVASTWITPSCLQFLGEKKRFHTAWTQLGHWPVNDPEGGDAVRHHQAKWRQEPCTFYRRRLLPETAKDKTVPCL
jgi:hypothetical protein